MTFSSRQLNSVVDSLPEFLKTFEKTNKCLQIPLPRPKIEMYLKIQNKNCLLINITASFNIQIDKLVHPSNLETTNPASFPSKRLNYRAINFFLRKMSTITIAKPTISTRTDITLQTSMK